MEPISAGMRATDAELDDALARAIRHLIAEAVQASPDEAAPVAADTPGTAAALACPACSPLPGRSSPAGPQPRDCSVSQACVQRIGDRLDVPGQ